jgi:glucokinase
MKYTVAVDVGGTRVRVALVDANGEIVFRLNETADKLSGPRGISQQLLRMIHLLESKGRICCVGIGSAGPLDIKNGLIVHSPHLGFDSIPLVKPLEEELKVPVYLANDCVAAVIGEKEFGEGKKCSNLVYVTISSGIGAGVFVDNHLLIGKDGNAHEIGHITIDCASKLVCGCGKRGHWEAYCGGANASNFIKYQLETRARTEIETSLLYRISEGDLSQLSSKDLYESAKKGDALAFEIVEEIGRLNAIGFANITNAYDPELIMIGGAIALANRRLILKPIRRLINQYSINKIPRIKITKLGEDIVLYGATVLSRWLK